MPNLASEVRVQEEQTAVRRIDSASATVAAMAGVSERGPIGVSTLSTSFAEWQKQHGDYTANDLDTVAAVQGYFDNGGVFLRFSRIVHHTSASDPTTKTSAKGTLTLQTAATAPTSGEVLSAAQPYNLDPGQTLVVKIDGGGDQIFTFAATSAARESAAENFVLADGQTLQVAIDGGSTLTKTFSASEFTDVGAATAEEVVASLNAFFASQGAGAVASVTSGGTKVTITSNRKGTGSIVNVIGGTANVALAFTTGALAGTGDVANIDAVTAAEVVSKLSSLTGSVASVVSNAVRIRSSTTGTGSSVQIAAASTADTALSFDNAIHSGSAGTAVNTLRIDGKTDGAYANALRAIVAAATSGEATRFNLYIERNGVTIERFENLSMLDTDERYVETIVNATDTGSDYVAAVDLDASPSDLPNTGTFGPLTGGNDGLSGLADTDFIGGDGANGPVGFRVFDADDIDLLVVPGRATSAVHNAMITYCEITRAGTCFAILDPPKSQTAAQMVTYVKSTASLKNLSEFAAIYWPNVKVVNPSATLYGNAKTVVVAPSGHIAGIYARTEARKIGGAFEQPAGIDFGVPRNVLGLEMDEVRKKAKRELVFPENINPISQETGTPVFLDGARCLKNNGNFGSVGQRRGVIFVEKRLTTGLAFMRHKNIRDELYREGERTVTVFLLELTANDAFKSRNPKKAFFVDFGEALNPPSVQAAKTVVGRIGLATSEPAEFIVLLVGPDTRALDEELAALAA